MDDDFSGLGFGETSLVGASEQSTIFGIKSRAAFDPEDVAKIVQAARRNYRVSAAAEERAKGQVFCSTPLPHQQTGLRELLDNPRWLFWWDMGTCKTATVAYRLAIGFREQEFRGPVLIVAPWGVVDVWRKELEQHIGATPFILGGNVKQRDKTFAAIAKSPVRSPIIVTNYEVLLSEWRRLGNLEIDAAIADEAHRACNVSTQTNKRLCRIAGTARYRWALTGTPIPNGPLNFLGIAVFLAGNKYFGTTSKRIFEHRHAIYGHEVAPFVRAVIGYTGLDKIAATVATFTSRVRKEECLNLPPVTITDLTCELSPEQKKLYKAIKKDAVAQLQSAKGRGELTIQNVLTQQLRLLQIAGGFVPDDDKTVHPIEPNGKLQALKAWAGDALLTPGAAIIWTAFVPEVDAIANMLRELELPIDYNVLPYHGALPPKIKQATIDAFHNVENPILVATAASTREGLTLIEASRAVFYSRGPFLLNWLQTKDRIHRYGQTKPVSIYKMIARGTADVMVDANLNKKAELQELLAGGASVEDMLGPDPF